MSDEAFVSFTAKCSRFEPVGSRVTCSPPPLDTDEDFLALVKDDDEAWAELLSMGFETGTDRDYDGMASNFISFKRGQTNVIVTEDEEWFKRFMAASHVAKRLNLLKKADRIALFQAVLYANTSEGS